MKKIGEVTFLLCILFCAMTFSPCFVFAAAKVKVEAVVPVPVVAVQDPFVLDLSIAIEGDGEIQEPDRPDFGGLQLLGQNSSLSMQSQLTNTPQGMQFIKKKIQTIRYSLQANKEGTFKIPPISVEVSGQKYSSLPLSIKVDNKLAKQNKPSGNQRRDQQRPRGLPSLPGFPNMPNPFNEDEEDSLLGQLLQRQMGNPPEEVHRNLPNVNTNEAFFITVELDKTVVFEGEQIFANWYIYTRGDLYQLDRIRFPSLKGFWKEDIEPAPALIYQNEIVNGVHFRKALLASYALFPIKEGPAVVDEYKVRAQVALPVPGFGGFSFGKPFSYLRSSERVPVTVNPLPLGNKPESFSGAVGVYDVTVKIDQQQIQQWKPFTLRIRFEGEGNAKLIDMPHIQFPESFDVFDSKSEGRFFKSGKSFKEFTLQLVPKESGTVTLPAISLSYFDTQQKLYVVKQSEPITLNVLAGEKPKNYDSTRLHLETEIKQEITELPEWVTSWNPHTPFAQWRWMKGPWAALIWGGLELLIFICLGFIYYLLSRVQTLQKDLRVWMSNKEIKIKKWIQEKNIRNAATDSLNLIYRILGGVSDEGHSGLEILKLIEQLPPSIRSEMGDELLKLVDRWQLLAFAPEEALGEWRDTNKVQELFKQTHHYLNLMLDHSQRLDMK